MAFSTADTSGFSLVTPESKWAYSYVQQVKSAIKRCYVLSEQTPTRTSRFLLQHNISEETEQLLPMPKPQSAFFRPQQEPAQSLCYIKVISSDGKQFWDITANLEAADEDAFEIFLQSGGGGGGGGPALRPLPHFGGPSSSSASKKVTAREERERAPPECRRRQRRRTMSSSTSAVVARSR